VAPPEEGWVSAKRGGERVHGGERGSKKDMRLYFGKGGV